MSVLIFWELENIASISFWVLPDLFVSYSAEKKKKAGSVAFVTCHSEYLVGRTALRLLMVFLGCFVNFCYKICFQKTFQCSLLIPQKYWCISYLSFFFFSAEGNVAWRDAICNGMSFCYLFLNIHIDHMYWKERCLFWDSWMSKFLFKRNWWSPADGAVPLEGKVSEVMLMQTHWRASSCEPQLPCPQDLSIFWHHFFILSGICFFLCIHLCIFCTFFMC